MKTAFEVVAAQVTVERIEGQLGSLRTELWTSATERGLDSSTRFYFVDKLLKEYGRNQAFEDDARLYLARIGGDLVGAAFTKRAHDGRTFIDGIGSLESGSGIGSMLLEHIRADNPKGIIGSAWPGSEGFWSGQGLLQDDGKTIEGVRRTASLQSLIQEFGSKPAMIDDGNFDGTAKCVNCGHFRFHHGGKGCKSATGVPLEPFCFCPTDRDDDTKFIDGKFNA